MAVQNFLSGGYYGKLGETVGQRWKNKRTIRTYVIPKNPRTEKQQANRGLFANAVTFAQIGLQMNYYATCFLSEEFTQWNYRMRVARQLREKGLSGLDLIPLYPLSFTPATLITSLEVSRVENKTHFIIKCDNLQGDNDRVLSVMFDIHDDKGEELGYKLYIGYYYASNKGFMEIDVDDPSEINEYLKVRIVSNDDVDSTTDLISSPTITIKPQQIEIRDFDTSIKSFSKSNQGITVIFNELWKNYATVNAISGSVRFVQNGNTVSHIFDSEPLVNADGYCSLFIPLVSSSNQYLPAFPEGSKISITDVNFSGSDFQYTKQNVSNPLVDTDLKRTLDAPINSSENFGVTLEFSLNYSGAEIDVGAGKILSHYWLTDNVEETCEFYAKKNDQDKLVLYANQDGKTLPMWEGDYISTPKCVVTQNGVTYEYKNLLMYPFTNNITERSWLTVRDFDSSIKSFSKSSSAIVVVFNEVWKSDAKVNTISANVSFVSNGAKTSKSVSGVALVNNGGYCSVSIPYATSDNQSLPAFPSGSQIVVSALELSNKAYSLTSSNVTKSLVDTDLTRTLNAPSNSSANYGVTLLFNFGYTGTEKSAGAGKILSHYWLTDNVEETCNYLFKKNSDGKLELYANQDGKTLPMWSGDYITTPEFSFVQNGVTYKYGALTKYAFTNNITERSWLTVRDFDSSIKSFSKSSSAIVVVFNEVWKSDAKVNTISANVSFVSNGAKTSKSVSGVALVNNGGYCSVSIPYATSDNQSLPAFPSGSQIVVSALELSNKAYSLTSSNVTKSLVDTDLTRTLNAPSNSSANYGVTLLFNFGYTGSGASVGNGNVLSHYWISGELEQEFIFKIKKNADGKLELYPETNGVNLPMLSGDYINTPKVSFVQNGVTYEYNALLGYSFENTIRETTWSDNIFDLSRAVEVWWGDPEGGDPSRVDLPLKSELLPDDYFEEFVTSKKAGDYFEINLDSGADWRVPSSVNSGDIKLTREATGEPARLAVEFYKAYTAPQSAVSCTLFGGAFKLVYNGVTYNAPSVDKLFDNMNNIPY